MPYDEELADRVRDALPGAIEKRMFGGLAFLLEGNLAVAVGAADLMVRVGTGATAEAVALPGVSPCVMGERTMKAWVLVETDAVREQADLIAWVERGAAFARTLPAK